MTEFTPFIIPVFIPHKGCPFRCVFCDQTKTSSSNNISLHQIISIQQYIDSWLSVNRIKTENTEIAFYGGTFTALPFDQQEKILSMADDYVKKGVVKSIRVSTRPDYIDPDRLNLLKQYAVNTVEIGVQSMDDEVLELSERGYKSADVVLASEYLKKFGFIMGIQLMVGLPGDNFERTQKSVKKIISLSPDFVRIYPVVVIKGTKLEKMFFDGSYTPLALDQAVTWCAAMLIEFKKKGINVIRIGLQSDSELEKDGNLVSGPFHPAFRQLVESNIAKRVIMKILKLEDFQHKTLIFYVPPKEVSNYVGQKKENIKAIKIISDVTIIIKSMDSLKPGTIKVDSGAGEIKCFNVLDIIEEINDKIKG